MTRANDNQPHGCRPALLGRGFSLIEILIVISLLGIFAGLVMTRWEPGLHDQLTSAAQVVAADMAYSRNLAVTYNSRYTWTFDLAGNRYVLEHSGTDPVLNTLPSSPYRQLDDAATQQTTDLAALPLGAAGVELVAVQMLTPAPVDVSDVEFGPLGETTRSETTMIWLAAGQGSTRVYMAIGINPVTGLTTIEALDTTSPVLGGDAAEDPPLAT